jgi:hypothetical protein
LFTWFDVFHTYIFNYLKDFLQGLRKIRHTKAKQHLCGLEYKDYGSIFLFLALDKVGCPFLIKYFDMPIWHPTDKNALDELLDADIDKYCIPIYLCCPSAHLLHARVSGSRQRPPPPSPPPSPAFLWMSEFVQMLQTERNAKAGRPLFFAQLFSELYPWLQSFANGFTSKAWKRCTYEFCRRGNQQLPACLSCESRIATLLINSNSSSQPSIAPSCSGKNKGRQRNHNVDSL